MRHFIWSALFDNVPGLKRIISLYQKSGGGGGGMDTCHWNKLTHIKGYNNIDDDDDDNNLFVCLFDLILYVHSTIFQLCGTGLPGLNQY